MSSNFFGDYIKFLGESVDSDLEDMVLESLPSGKNISYLDVGCYDGTKTLVRANKIGTKKIIGIDVLAGSTKIARKKGLKVIFCDLNKKWPLRNKSVDCITATEVIEHLVDEDNFFSEVKRVLSPGGRIIITTDNLAGYHNIFALIVGNQPYSGPYISKVYPIGHRPHAKFYKPSLKERMNPHLNVMTARALRQLLTFYGFKIIKQGGAGMYPLPPFIAKLTSKLDKNHASHMFYCAKLPRRK